MKKSKTATAGMIQNVDGPGEYAPVYSRPKESKELRADSIEEMTVLVKAAIVEGWQPVGGLFSCKNNHFTQTVERKEAK